jgi:hypothetical protein
VLKKYIEFAVAVAAVISTASRTRIETRGQVHTLPLLGEVKSWWFFVSCTRDVTRFSADYFLLVIAIIYSPCLQ